MNILSVFVWLSTITFTIITLLPFAVPTIVFHWTVRALSAVLAIIGWVLVIRLYMH